MLSLLLRSSDDPTELLSHHPLLLFIGMLSASDNCRETWRCCVTASSHDLAMDEMDLHQSRSL